MGTELDAQKRALLIQCAEMKHVEKLSNSDIAERLSFSVAHVGRLLVAGGNHKHKAIHVAVRTGMVDGLITDEAAAE